MLVLCIAFEELVISELFSVYTVNFFITISHSTAMLYL